MRAQVILCDFAQVSEGKLTVVGAGWDRKALHSPMSVGVLVYVPWTQTNQKHRWLLRLVHSDGEPVKVPTPEGDQMIQLDGEFELGRPPGVRAGSELPFALALNVGPIPLEPETGYEWFLEIDGSSEDAWRAPFMTQAN